MAYQGHRVIARYRLCACKFVEARNLWPGEAKLTSDRRDKTMIITRETLFLCARDGSGSKEPATAASSVTEDATKTEVGACISQIS